MSLYQLNKMLYDVGRQPEMIQEFKVNSEAVLSRYDLSALERNMILSGTARDLYEAGVQPNLIFKFAALRSIPPMELYRS